MFDYAKPFTISFVIPGMRQMWGLSAVSASYLPIAGLSGTMVGSVLWGFAADRIGRRATLLWTVGIFSAATVCGLALQYWQSLLACFVMGLGVGGEAPIVFALAAEYLPVRVRGRLLLFLGIVGSTAGYALAAVIATVATALFPDTVAWRLMLKACAWIGRKLCGGCMRLTAGRNCRLLTHCYPASLCRGSRCIKPASVLSVGGPAWIRTRNQRLMRALLCP